MPALLRPIKLKVATPLLIVGALAPLRLAAPGLFDRVNVTGTPEPTRLPKASLTWTVTAGFIGVAMKALAGWAMIVASAAAPGFTRMLLDSPSLQLVAETVKLCGPAAL